MEVNLKYSICNLTLVPPAGRTVYPNKCKSMQLSHARNISEFKKGSHLEYKECTTFLKRTLAEGKTKEGTSPKTPDNPLVFEKWSSVSIFVMVGTERGYKEGPWLPKRSTSPELREVDSSGKRVVV